MSDSIGNIIVPEIAVSGTFPIVSDYPYGCASQPEVAIHQFGSGNAKIEQRFLLGTGAKRFTVRRTWLRDADRIALRDFWETMYGPYGAFTYNAPNDDGVGTTAYTCRFGNEPLSWEMIADWACSIGITLVEIPATTPDYTLNSTVTRFPSQVLSDALLAQVQQVIPLLKIQPLEAGYPAIYLSDRRCTVGGQLYQARLLSFDGISQGMAGESDDASFTFGNADRVMRDLANDVDLYRATIGFSLFHVGTGVKVDLWKGDIVNWSLDDGPEFKVTAADGLYELNLPYPPRKISRACWKPFNSQACPYAQQGALDLVHFPSADATKCDKGYDTPNGCLAHGMKRYYGAILAEPQGVRVKDNSTGTWGFGRSPLTSVSQVAESIYDQVLPQIYTDSDMPVNCKVAAGRDESDFYEAMGIVGEGPLTLTTPRMVDKDGDGNAETFVGHTLDGQMHHGFPNNSLGLRTISGNDPAGANEYFSLDQSGNQTGVDWRKVYFGNSTYKDNFAAGTAAVVIRRTDPKGLQLSKPAEHQMVAVVSQGLRGWIWTDSGDHQTFVRGTGVLTNPLWIAVNMLLRARGVWLSDAATQEQFFDVKALADATLVNGKPKGAALVADLMVDALVGAGQETQFKFRGVMQEEKPLRDWLQEVLMNCLGYFTFTFGRLKLGVRQDSSAVEAFTEGNILFRSLQLAPLKPGFNHLTANFADGEYDFVTNSVTVYDIDHASLVAGGAGPLFLKSNVNLAGTSSKSQASRIISVRLREELGGITPAEWKKARQMAFRTTVLALNTEPGMVCSMTHPSMPGGLGEFRVTSWTLNPDFSIDIQGRTTTDSMYDLLTGPKPADVAAAPVPTEITDPMPGDVRPIDADPFLVTQTPLPSGDVAFDFEYDPPDPISSFSGVYGVFEIPDGDGKLSYSTDQPYVPISETNRHGTCRIVMPAPGAPEDWRVALCSCARTFRKAYVAHDDASSTPTPNTVLSVEPSSASAGQVDLADVRNVSVSTPTPVIHEEVLKAMVRVNYTAPDDLGEGDLQLKMVQVHVATSLGLDRLQAVPFTGAAGQEAWFELYLPYPPEDAEDDYTIYLCSKSDRYEDALVLDPLDPGVTPHATVHMPANPSNWPAPDVVGFQAGSITGAGVFNPTPVWEAPLNKRMLIDWGCMLPGDLTNWSKVAIFIKTPLACIQATGLLDADIFAPSAEGGFSHYDCIAIEGADLPDVPEQWEIIACSYNRAGIPNFDSNGIALGPKRTLMTLPKANIPSFETPGNVTGLAVDASQMNGADRMLVVGYNPPSDTPCQGAQFYLERPAGTTPIALESVDGDGTSGRQTATLYQPAPPDGDVVCKLWAVPYSPTVAAKLVTTGANASGSVTFTLPRCPLVAQPANVTVNVKIDTDEGKNPVWSVSGGWTAITDPLFEAVAVDCVWSGGAVMPLGAWKGTAIDPFAAGPWPITTPDTATLKFYSVNVLGVRNTTNPVVMGPYSIERQVGAPGVENCANAAAFNAWVEYDNGAGPDGTEHWRLKWSMTAPSDKRWAGYKIVLRPASGGADTTIEPAGGQVAGDWWPIGAPEAYTAYCVSRDAAGRWNTIVVGTTPQKTGLAVQAQTSGKLPANRLDPNTYDTTIFGKNTSGKWAQLAVDFGKPKSGTFDSNIFGVDGNGVFKQVAVDLSLPKAGSYDANLFKSVGGVFKANLSNQFDLTQGFLRITTIDCDVLRSGNIQVGNVTGRPAGIFAYKYNVGTGMNDLVAWFGWNGSIVGGWVKEFYAGGTSPADAKLKIDAAGNLTMVGTLIGAASQFSGTIGANQINANTLAVGGNGQAVGVYVYKWTGSVNQLVGWLGANGAYVGGWVKEFYIGGNDPASAQIYCNSSGSAVFNGTLGAAAVLTSSLDITGAGAHIQINTTDGFKVSAGNYYATMNSGYFEARYLYNTTTWFKAWPFGIELQADTGRYISISGTSTIRSIDMTSNSGLLQVEMSAGDVGWFDVRNGGEYRSGGVQIIDASQHIKGKHVPRYFAQSGRPALDDGEFCFEWDSTVGNLFLIVRQGGNYWKFVPDSTI